MAFSSFESFESFESFRGFHFSHPPLLTAPPPICAIDKHAERGLRSGWPRDCRRWQRFLAVPATAEYVRERPSMVGNRSFARPGSPPKRPVHWRTVRFEPKPRPGPPKHRSPTRSGPALHKAIRFPPNQCFRSQRGARGSIEWLPRAGSVPVFDASPPRTDGSRPR
jgi:hypothetical protein